MEEFYWQRSVSAKLEDLDNEERILKLDVDAFASDFPHFARESMQRYKQSNTELYKLILKMTIDDDNYASLGNELIMDALNLSVKKLHIEIRAIPGKKLSLTFVLPGQVFDYGSLNELFAHGCEINRPTSGSVTRSGLVSLGLKSVTIRDDDVMADILSKCPLIEYLDLIEIVGLKNISICKMQHNLKHFSLRQYTEDTFVDFSEQGFTQFPNFISLDFTLLNLPKTLFHDSMFKFTCLTYLTLCRVYGFEGIVDISLPLLKYLDVGYLMEAKWVFDVPNIQKFKCWGYLNMIPPLYISTSSKQWESADVEFDCDGEQPSSWFSGLREFLQNLSVSNKMFLGLSFEDSFIDQPCIDKFTEEDLLGVSCIPVENLAFKDLLAHDSISLPAFSNLVRGLFSTCRPSFITLIETRSHPTKQPSGRRLPALELLCQSVTKQDNWKGDLKQVTFEMLFKEETTQEWRPILWDDLIASVSLNIQGFQIRLKLEWHGVLN